MYIAMLCYEAAWWVNSSPFPFCRLGSALESQGNMATTTSTRAFLCWQITQSIALYVRTCHQISFANPINDEVTRRLFCTSSKVGNQGSNMQQSVDQLHAMYGLTMQLHKPRNSIPAPIPNTKSAPSPFKQLESNMSQYPKNPLQLHKVKAQWQLQPKPEDNWLWNGIRITQSRENSKTWPSLLRIGLQLGWYNIFVWRFIPSGANG